MQGFDDDRAERPRKKLFRALPIGPMNSVRMAAAAESDCGQYYVRITEQES